MAARYRFAGQIVELNASELARAADCAQQRNRMRLVPDGDDGAVGRAEALHDIETARFYNELGAQGEIAVGKVLGIEAPLGVNTFRSSPDLPPAWSVKTQLSTSTDTKRGYLRIRERNLHPDWSYVLVERDVLHLAGTPVFLVHGFVSDAGVARYGRRLYSYSSNIFVHISHLRPLEPLCQLDEARILSRAERWHYNVHGRLADGYVEKLAA